MRAAAGLMKIQALEDARQTVYEANKTANYDRMHDGGRKMKRMKDFLLFILVLFAVTCLAVPAAADIPCSGALPPAVYPQVSSDSHDLEWGVDAWFSGFKVGYNQGFIDGVTGKEYTKPKYDSRHSLNYYHGLCKGYLIGYAAGESLTTVY